jgi:polyprenyl-phospho-N-acetylgalactosaminyl synthase
MLNKKDVYIVIAAYNEGKSIKKVVASVKNAGYNNIIVIDDCSRDNTYEVISKLPIFALKHIMNRGQGASLKTGIDFALSKNAKYIVTFDADGQHRPEDLDAMVKPVVNNVCDITLGSRFLNKKTKMPFTRYITLKVGVIMQWIFYGILLTDAHNGFRCLSRHAAKKINIISDRMEHASEIVEEIKKNKLRYKEIPVIIHYTEETLAKGHGGFSQAIKVLWKMLIKKLL